MSYYAGIDSGSTYCKCVIIGGDGVLGKAKLPVEANPKEATGAAMKQALKEAGLKKPKQIAKFGMTGRNQRKVPFPGEELSVITCAAKGAYAINPQIRTLIDIGGFTNKAIKLNQRGKVMDYVVNDKCASGSGLFLELVARAIEMDIKEFGNQALHSTNPVPVTAQCSIFAESEVIYLVNEGNEDVDIAAGVCTSIVSRLYSLLKRVDVEEEVTLVGGVANNSAIWQGLEQRLGFCMSRGKLDPIFVPAFGAALIAREYS